MLDTRCRHVSKNTKEMWQHYRGHSEAQSVPTTFEHERKWYRLDESHYMLPRTVGKAVDWLTLERMSRVGYWVKLILNAHFGVTKKPDSEEKQTDREEEAYHMGVMSGWREAQQIVAGIAERAIHVPRFGWAAGVGGFEIQRHENHTVQPAENFETHYDSGGDDKDHPLVVVEDGEAER